jgi:hypothetical protein
MIGRIVERDDEDYAVIASTPRSGTTYIRAVLAACGVRSGHENVFKSSGGVSRPPDWLTVEVSGFAGLHPLTNTGPVLHQVRHPLKVVSSLATLGLLRTHDPIAVAEWYLTVFDNNQMAADFTYRVEDMNRDLLETILGLLGEDVDPTPGLEVPTDTNSRPRTDLAFSDLGVFGDEVATLAGFYGYL